VTVQKNLFGQLSCITAIFWINAYLAKQSKPHWSLAGIALSVMCVLLSRSSTALLVTMLVSCFMLLTLRSPRRLRRYIPYIVGTFVALVLTYGIAVLDLVPGLDVLLTPVTEFTGKDTTFSNRSMIWTIIRDHIQLSPIVGSGYGAYWIGPVAGSPSAIFIKKMYFYPHSAHNGYLEIINDLGFVGLGALFAFMITYVRSALEVVRYNRPLGALFLAIFFEELIVNLTESSWLQVDAPAVFDIMALCVLGIAITLQQRDAAARAAGATPPAYPPRARTIPPPMARPQRY
jgi:O-antigen ligase